LTVGIFFVGWDYVPSWSLGLDFAVMVYGRVKFWTDIYPNIIVDAEYERDMARFREFIVPGDETEAQPDPARILDKPRRKKKKAPAEESKGEP